MASPNFRINGNAVGTPASVAAAGAVTATLDSTDGVRQVEWSIASTDETTAIGDYTLVQSGSVGQTATCTALTAGTAAILRAKINGGINLSTGLNDPTGTEATGKFYVLTAGGYAVGCVNEIVEHNGTYGWAAILNPIIRAVPSAVVTSVSGTAPIVSSGGVTPAISITAASAIAAGSQSAAQFTLVNGATSVATIAALARRGSAGEAAFAYLYPSGSVPTTGFIRGQSGFVAIATLTAAGSFDNVGVSDDGADGWKIGNDTRAASVRLSVKTGGAVTWEVNNGVEGTMDASGVDLASGNSFQIGGRDLVSVVSSVQQFGSGTAAVEVLCASGQSTKLTVDITTQLTADGDGITINNAFCLGTGTTPQGVQTVTGSRGGNAALASLLTAMQTFGLIVDSTTP